MIVADALIDGDAYDDVSWAQIIALFLLLHNYICAEYAHACRCLSARMHE